MAHPEMEAAVAEAQVVETAPDNSQAVETNDVQEQADEPDFYDEGDPFEGEPEAEEQEQGGEPKEAIAAPASLNSEEKDRFAQLPGEAQRAISDILQRRDRETQQGLESARAAQQQAQAAAADQIAQTQAQYAETFQNFVQAFAPQPPTIELAQQDPQAYLVQKAIYDEEVQRFQQIVGGISSLKEQSDQHFKAQEQAETQARLRGLMGIPEFANDQTRAEFIGGIQSVGEAMGYDVQTLSQMDTRDMTALKRAREWKAGYDKWVAHEKRRNERPRAATGRFSAAPAGNRAAAAPAQTDTLKALYPND